jgi:hypothetical protein
VVLDVAMPLRQSIARAAAPCPRPNVRPTRGDPEVGRQPTPDVVHASSGEIHGLHHELAAVIVRARQRGWGRRQSQPLGGSQTGAASPTALPTRRWSSGARSSAAGVIRHSPPDGAAGGRKPGMLRRSRGPLELRDAGAATVYSRRGGCRPILGDYRLPRHWRNRQQQCARAVRAEVGKVAEAGSAIVSYVGGDQGEQSLASASSARASNATQLPSADQM